MSELQIHMNKKITDYLNSGRSVMAIQGARRASKTYTIMQWLLLNAYNNGDVCLVVSMTAEQGRTGAYEDANTILRSWGTFGDLFEVGKSPRRIVCKRTNTRSGRQGVIEFTAYDDPERGKGIACDWVFLNEANKFSRQQYLDAAANARKGVVCDFNPNKHFWIEDELKDEDILKVSWQDNKYLTPAQLQWFAKLKENAERPNATATDRYFYEVYYCNQYSDLAGDIFTPAVIRKCKPDEVPIAELRNPVVFGDPSALCGNDYFPLTLSAVGPDGTIYILDADSVNSGAKAERCTAIERMQKRLDGVRVYIESNGIGKYFIEYARGENKYEQPPRPLTVEGWRSSDGKFDRILAQYETIRDRVVFVEQPRLNEYLAQVYDFSRTCQHDDNIDNIASVCMLHQWLAN